MSAILIIEDKLFVTEMLGKIIEPRFRTYMKRFLGVSGMKVIDKVMDLQASLLHRCHKKIARRGRFFYKRVNFGLLVFFIAIPFFLGLDQEGRNQADLGFSTFISI